MSSALSGRKLKACINCTRAKVRCTPLGSLPDVCTRCHRLAKACVYEDAMARPRKDRTTKHQKLEAKVDNLLNLLANAVPRAVNTAAPPEPTTGISPGSGSGSVASQATPQFPLLSLPATGNALPSAHRSDPSVSDQTDTPDLIESGLVSVALAEELFAFYCNSLVIQFPYVTFLPTENLATMRSSRPLLLLSILAVGLARDIPRLERAGDEVAEMIHSKMRHRSNFSLDLLQAIMVHTAWHQFFFDVSTQQYFLMTQYCITLVHELGLDRTQGSQAYSLMVFPKDTRPHHPRQSEAYRALLGTFCLVSGFSQMFRKPRQMPTTKHLKKCCQLLAQANDSIHDQWIAFYVELEDIILDACDTFSLHDVENSEVSGDLVLQSLVGKFSYRIQLLEQNLPPSSDEQLRRTTELQILHAYIRAHEVAVHADLWTKPSSQKSNASTELSVVRTKMLGNIIKYAKRYFDIFEAFAPLEYYHLTAWYFAQVLYVLIVINRIIALDLNRKSNAPITAGSIRNPDGATTWSSALVIQESGLTQFGRGMRTKLAMITPEETVSEKGKNVMWVLSLLIASLTKASNKNDAMESVDEAREQMTRNSRYSFDQPDNTPAPPPTMENFDSSNYTTAMPDLSPDQFSNMTSDQYVEAWNTMLQDLTYMPLPMFDPNFHF